MRRVINGAIGRYTIRESERAQQIRVTVYPNGHVVVTKPGRVTSAVAVRFAEARRSWIKKALADFERRRVRDEKAGMTLKELPRYRSGTRAHRAAVAAAQALVAARLPVMNAVSGYRHGRMTIRSQRTRWGSCSSKGNLSFNYRTLYLPLLLVDYIIVHELCHLREMNHSPRFWTLVGQTIPNYKQLRKELRRYRL